MCVSPSLSTRNKISDTVSYLLLNAKIATNVSHQNRTKLWSITSQVKLWFTAISHVNLCLKRIWKNEIEWTGKANKPNNSWPTQCFRKRIFDSSGLSAHGSLISASSVPSHRGVKGGGTDRDRERDTVTKKVLRRSSEYPQYHISASAFF